VDVNALMNIDLSEVTIKAYLLPTGITRLGVKRLDASFHEKYKKCAWVYFK